MSWLNYKNVSIWCIIFISDLFFFINENKLRIPYFLLNQVVKSSSLVFGYFTYFICLQAKMMNKIVEDYVLMEGIGKGQYGNVYRA